jgi:hypothetical protein
MPLWPGLRPAGWAEIAAGDADAIGEAVGVGPAAALIAWWSGAPACTRSSARSAALAARRPFASGRGGRATSQGTGYGRYALTVPGAAGCGLVAAAALGDRRKAWPPYPSPPGAGSWAVTPLVVLGLMALAYRGY